MNFSGVRLDMSFKEAKELDDILARNKAKPVEANKYISQGKEGYYYTCPVCGEFVYEGYEFCRTCGQRLDMENIAL